ncbi:transcription-repair coupling factor [Candidatus Auribacterota bacterium]
MKDLFDLAAGSEKFKQVLDKIACGKSIAVAGLEASSKEFFLSVLIKECKKPVLYIVKGPKEQDFSHGNLRVFTDAPVYSFPSIDVIPGQGVHQQIEITSDRISILHEMLNMAKRPFCVIATAHSITQRVIPPSRMRSLIIRVKLNGKLNLHDFCGQIASTGYEPAPIIEKKGDYSVRGGVVDVYPVNSPEPYRVEFLGDRIDSIRMFDLFTQKSVNAVDDALIAPCKEVEEIKKSDAASIADYFSALPGGYLVVFDELREIEESSGQFGKELANTDIEIGFDEFNDSLSPRQKIFLNLLPQSFDETSRLPRIDFDVKRADFLSAGNVIDPKPGIKRDKFKETLMKDLPSKDGDRDAFFLNNQDSVLSGMCRFVGDNYTVTVVCNNDGEKQRYKELVEEKGMPELEDLSVIIGRMNTGFIIPGIKLAVVADQDIFSRYKVRALTRKYKGVNPITELTEIKNGDHVVHINYGIGRYRGLEMLEKDGLMQEFLAIEYAERSVLYVPIENINLVERYIGIGKKPQLDKLGATRWNAVKKRAQIATAGTAAELLEVQAAREALEGIPHAKDVSWQRDFESAFIYEETPDQIQTIEEVKKDMEARRPMDRLICGDVGYGKTEVAMRAAFKAVMDNRQVAILVPTTILADQHHRTFSERMKDYPIRVEMLSRFKTKGEQKNILKDLRDNKVNIVIGTHRLLQKDVEIGGLGLVIIDEEQRFGVKHKERFKQLRKLVDVLTMTATPIPRTLYLSFMGAKDMSSINTPPENRLPIETNIVEYSDELVRKAVIHEMAREGQVFFVHNRVQTIDKVKEKLQRLVPEARIMTAHGQMDEGELSEIMHHFVSGNIDVLVCTTIIESGLDIPNANTIIIDRADRFGLAELYQLRGRVGRYNVRAYAYLLFPRDRVLLEAARKRLRALIEFSGMGSGFKLAMKDLEIRGAGNILGSEQHGHIVAVGFDLYCRLLKQSIVRLNGMQPLAAEKEVALKLGFRPFIPVTYVGDESIRIDLYKRISNSGAIEEIPEIEEELRDRFGPVPEAVKLLLGTTAVKILARAKDINYIELKDGKLMLKRSGDSVMFEGRHARINEKTPVKIVKEVKKVLRSAALK